MTRFIDNVSSLMQQILHNREELRKVEADPDGSALGINPATFVAMSNPLRIDAPAEMVDSLREQFLKSWGEADAEMGIMSIAEPKQPLVREDTSERFNPKRKIEV